MARRCWNLSATIRICVYVCMCGCADNRLLSYHHKNLFLCFMFYFYFILRTCKYILVYLYVLMSLCYPEFALLI